MCFGIHQKVTLSALVFLSFISFVSGFGMLGVFLQFRVFVSTLILLVFAITASFFLAPFRIGFADNFDDLMGEAIEHGTQIDAARSRRDAADASVKRAWSKFLPSFQGYGEFGYNKNNALGRLDGLNRDHHDNSQLGVSANLPLYRGGANYYGLKEARATARAENYSFLESKQLLLLDTARAILGIIRDRKIVALQRENRSIVASIVRTTVRRFEGGEATKTDIELARDQFTSVQSVYEQALDNLHQNEVEFKRLIGRAPGKLSFPRSIHKRLPRSLAQAAALADKQNPQLLSALMRQQAAEYSHSASNSKFLPTVDLNLDYSEDRYHGRAADDESDFSVKLNFSVPLFQPDAFPAKEESQHRYKQRQYEARDARAQARAMARVAWNSYKTAQKKYRLARARIKAAQGAASGMRRELEAGQRTVLDVLDTQERLVQAKVQAANARYESYMSAHLLLSAIGQLEAKGLGSVEYVSYVNSAKRRGAIKKVNKSKWQLQEAKVSQPKAPKRFAQKNEYKIADAAYEELPWLTSSVKTPRKKQARAFKLTSLPVPKTAFDSGVDEGVLTNSLRADSSISLPQRAPLYLKTKSEFKTDVEIPKKERQPIMRKTIYSQHRQVQDDEIVTGTLAPKSPIDIKPYKKTAFNAFSVHRIPLPQKKDSFDEEIVTGSVTPPVARDVVEYPDTYRNRFALWWNKGVDVLVGPEAGPKPVLVPLDEYRRKRRASM